MRVKSKTGKTAQILAARMYEYGSQSQLETLTSEFRASYNSVFTTYTRSIERLATRMWTTSSVAKASESVLTWKLYFESGILTIFFDDHCRRAMLSPTITPVPKARSKLHTRSEDLFLVCLQTAQIAAPDSTHDPVDHEQHANAHAHLLGPVHASPSVHGR